MRRYCLAFCFIIGLFTSGMNQPLIQIHQKAQQAYIDVLGNIYLINNTELLKYNQEGKLMHRYSNSLYGIITSVDVSNPLRIMLFYQESSYVAFMNQQLSLISDPIDCFELIGSNVSHACIASDGGFWLFSPEQQKIVHLSENRIIDKESQPLNDWLINDKIITLKEKNQKVALVSDTKVLLFDTFGSYLTSIHFDSIKSIFFTEKQLIVFNGNQLSKYNLLAKQHEIMNIHLPPGFISLYFTGKKHVWVYADSVAVIHHAPIP